MHILAIFEMFVTRVPEFLIPLHVRLPYGMVYGRVLAICMYVGRYLCTSVCVSARLCTCTYNMYNMYYVDMFASMLACLF